MAKQIGEDTKVTLDLKTIGMLAAGIAALVGMWFALQADIQEAKELPEPTQVPVEQMIQIQKELTFIKTEMLEMKETLNRLDDRIYSLKK